MKNKMTENTNKIITRFPPSPTGWFHIGNARTALFNYFYTKKVGGTLKFRLEDTDKERSKQEYADPIWMAGTFCEISRILNLIFLHLSNEFIYRLFIESIYLYTLLHGLDLTRKDEDIKVDLTCVELAIQHLENHPDNIQEIFQ